MFAAISDNALAIIVAAVVAGYVEWSRQRTARMVAGVKADLKTSDKVNTEKLDSIEKTGRAVHFLTNSSMLQQLRISSLALRRIAILTNGTPQNEGDVEAAEQAEKLYADHALKQTYVDAMPGPAPK